MSLCYPCFHGAFWFLHPWLVHTSCPWWWWYKRRAPGCQQHCCQPADESGPCPAPPWSGSSCGWHPDWGTTATSDHKGKSLLSCCWSCYCFLHKQVEEEAKINYKKIFNISEKANEALNIRLSVCVLTSRISSNNVMACLYSGGSSFSSDSRMSQKALWTLSRTAFHKL